MTRRFDHPTLLDAVSGMMALPDKGELIVYKPSDNQFEQVARIKVSHTATYAHPVVSGKRIFVKDLDSVTRWIVE